MSEYFYEDEPYGKAYDSTLMRRLLGYVKPYKGLFVLAVGLVLMVTAFDLSLPYLTKTAIDQFIILPYQTLDASNSLSISTDELQSKWGAIPIGEDRYLINFTELDPGLRQAWEAQGKFDRTHFFILRPDAPENARNIASSYPDIFTETADGTLYASEDGLSQISLDQRIQLRGSDLEMIGMIALTFIGVLFLRFFFSFGQVYVLQYTGQRVMFDMRRDIFGHLLRLPAAFFDREPVGKLVTRATNDVSSINEMYTAVLVNLFRDVFLIIGIVAIMFSLNWQLTALILILAPILAAITLIFRKYARKAYREVRLRISMLNAFLAEHISGMRIIHLFAQEHTIKDRFTEINDAKFRAEMRQTLTFALFNPLISVMSHIAIAVLIWYGGGQVVQSTLSLGALVAFITYTRMLFQPINDLSEKFNILQSAMASSERIFNLMNETREDRGRGEVIPKPVQGSIEFRDVWFSYNPDDWVLRGVSFKVEPGQTVAIVGATGSGKTTIISLIQRLYDIQKGQILLDGVDIRDLDLDELRAQMAVVLQDVFLFSGDILGNIKLQADHISHERATMASRFVQADSFIKDLEGGYHAEVTERGSTLSAGQRQLLAFARAVAFDPKVLVLDEATANIDSETEGLIQEALEKILEGRTSIVIAHRLSTIRDADQILVLDQGLLAEQGTHEELLTQKGLYATLHDMQFAETKA
jgi:ABC-type multidrug transport system fused ATPase/permease subunit